MQTAGECVYLERALRAILAASKTRAIGEERDGTLKTIAGDNSWRRMAEALIEAEKLLEQIDLERSHRRPAPISRGSIAATARHRRVALKPVTQVEKK